MLLSEDEQVSQEYKNGPLGSVPIDWEKTPFSELFVSFIEYTNDLDRFPLYSLTIEDGVTAKTERYERSHLVKKKNLYKVVRPNDFVYNPMNVRFGAIARYKGSSPVAVSGYYDVFSSVHESDSVFMENFLTFAPIISYYNKVSTGSLIEKQRVHFSKFLKFAFPLPSLQERKKIAAILSTQDKVIELKEKLLVQKQQQKKYLMQQLLTGKLRLPDVNGEWTSVKLKELLIERNEKNVEQNHRICSVAVSKGVVDQIEHLGRSYAAADTSNYGVAHYGDIIYTKSPTGDFSLGIIKQNRMRENVAISPLYGIYKPISFSTGYLLNIYFESTINTKNYLTPIVQKGAKNTIAISNSAFLENKIFFPMDEATQSRIAKVFELTDHEIDLFQKSIEAEKQKKKALMQLLLTGKVRVK